MFVLALTNYSLSQLINGEVTFFAKYSLIELPNAAIGVMFNYDNVNFTSVPGNSFNLSLIVSNFIYPDSIYISPYVLANFEINRVQFIDILLKYKVYRLEKCVPEAVKYDTLRTNRFGQTISIPDFSTYYVLFFSDTISCDSVVNDLKQIDLIQCAEKEFMLHDQEEPVECGYQSGTFWHLNDLDYQFDIKPAGAWNREAANHPDSVFNNTNFGKNTIVAVMETYGVQQTFQCEMELEEDPDDSLEFQSMELPDTMFYSEHGFCVSSFINARWDNDLYCGVHPNVKIRTYCISEDDTAKPREAVRTFQRIWDDIRQYNLTGLDVINCSWGNDTYDVMIDECIDVCAMNYNILVVCAAGNIAHNNDWFWPAANEKALAVSAIDDNGAFPYGYHQGLYIDCCAPGINVYCLEPGGTCNPRSGTSFSAPQVSALAAWIFSINPNLQWFEVYNIITMTCNTAGLVDYDSSKFGYGLINMDKADSLTRIWYELESFPGNKPASDNMVQVLDNNFRIDSCPNPFNPQSELTFDLPSAGLVELVIYDITGREVAVLQNEILPPGTYHRVFEGAELASGVYFACLQVQGERLTRKIILLK